MGRPPWSVNGLIGRGKETCATMLSLFHDVKFSMMWWSSKRPSPDVDTVILNSEPLVLWEMSSLWLTLPVDTKTNLGNLLFHELWKPMTFSKDAQSKPHLRRSQNQKSWFPVSHCLQMAKVGCPIEQTSGTWLHISLSQRPVDTSRGMVLLRAPAKELLLLPLGCYGIWCNRNTQSAPDHHPLSAEWDVRVKTKMNAGRALAGSSEEQLEYVGRRQQLLAELCCLSTPCQPVCFLPTFWNSSEERQGEKGRQRRAAHHP